MSTATTLPIIHGGETLRQATYSYINGVIDIEDRHKIVEATFYRGQTALQCDIVHLLNGEKLVSDNTITLGNAIQGMRTELGELGNSPREYRNFGSDEFTNLREQYHILRAAQLCVYAAEEEHGLWVVLEHGSNGVVDVRGAGRLLGFETYGEHLSPVVEQADGNPALLRNFGNVALYENLVGDELERHLQSLHRNS